jgi:hypothetical protein
MASRKIEDLNPELQERYRAFAAAMAEAGIPFILTCTARTVREQLALYAQGREQLDHVNSLRKLAGLPPITGEGNTRVTWTLQSKHLIDLDDGNPENDKARAFDIAIQRDGRPCWDLKVNVNQNDRPDYEEAGRIGESVGLRWGGRWKKPDYPHFEI